VTAKLKCITCTYLKDKEALELEMFIAVRDVDITGSRIADELLPAQQGR
jgi:hypothetical protein